MAHVLVTGGSGYFGFALVRALAAAGHQVRILDLLPAPEVIPGVEVVQGDVCDPAVCAAVMRGIEVVHHNVAVVPLGRNEALFWRVNRDGTRTMLDAAAAAGVRKIVYMSSSAVFGVPDHLPVTEDTPPTPGEAYGAAKLAGEQLCRERTDLDITVIRPRTILGPGRLGIMQILFEWVRGGRNVPVLDGGASVYQFVHEKDLISACMLAMDRPGSTTYNIGAESFGTLRETLTGLCDHAGTGSQVRSFPSAPLLPVLGLTNRLGLTPLAAYHSLVYHKSLWFDVSKAKAELGWRAEYSNVDSLVHAYQWYLDHRDEVLRATDRSLHRGPVKQGLFRLLSRLW
jgi:nucleoside-diphosphate-sugar epimerase